MFCCEYYPKYIMWVWNGDNRVLKIKQYIITGIINHPNHKSPIFWSLTVTFTNAQTEVRGDSWDKLRSEYITKANVGRNSLNLTSSKR